MDNPAVIEGLLAVISVGVGYLVWEMQRFTAIVWEHEQRLTHVEDAVGVVNHHQ